MTEFVGRTGANRVYSYPEAPRGAGPANYAKNYASGPSADTPIAGSPGTQVPWATVDVGVAGVSVQITPRVTGIIRVMGVLTIEGGGEGAIDVQVQVQVNGVTQAIPEFEFNTVGNTETEAVPFMVEISGLPIGTTKNIQILLTASNSPGAVLSEQSSTIEVQEVPASTG